MTTEQIALNFRLLSHSLKVAEFIQLEPDVQATTLESAIALLLDKSIPATDLRRLAAYLRALHDGDISDSMRAEIADALQGWDFAPF